VLTAAVLVPFLGALAVAAWRGAAERTLRLVATAVSAVPLALLVVAWFRFDLGSHQLFQLGERAEWIPTLGVAWSVGVDGISLAIVTMAAVVFTAAIAYPVDTRDRANQYYAWLLFLEAVSVGLFVTTDLLVFYIFFDLSLVGMYFLIARWGHGQSRFAALKFFLYTLAGSLVMLLGILGLYLNTEPRTFDMATIIRTQPLAGVGTEAGLVLLALLVGLAVKTPLVPVHTWLPPAHVDAPGPASAILAGVLLKMGTYGMVRIPLQMMRDEFADWAIVLVVVATVSVVYGAFTALGQRNLKARVAYTSINHMGYAVLGIAVAGALTHGQSDARNLALTGATVEMVAHGLITGTLFLIAGSFWRRTEEYDLDHYGGLAAPARKLAFTTTLAAFASLGLPGLAGFVAEIQIFIGTFAIYPVAGAVALIGLLVTAALFLQMLQKLFFGELPAEHRTFADLGAREMSVVGALLALVVVIGVYPRFLLDLIDTTTRMLTGGV
jgi:NADH-quinone oxidoreductase subunit M